ncbi:MAG: hypothetical protein RLZZ04_3628 [Cyanobacteriota bacterium]|jgi:hypothetical protein
MSETGDYNNSGSEFKSDRYIQIYVEARHPELLQGLEELLLLGLINQGQVKKLARHRLSCALPTPQVVPSIPTSAATNSLSNPSPLYDSLENSPEVLVPATTSTSTSNTLQRVLQSFLDELSICWLLFLGIFLVVVSSGVLAASQWQNFPNFGQYLILLVYTLSFWGIGYWTGKQASLKLTSQTLTAIATLLIPINFWAMSHLGLGHNPGEWGIIVLAVSGLSLTSYVSWLQSKGLFWLRLLFWGLSYLQLGWHMTHFPLLAIYGGIGIICLTHRQLLLPRRKYPLVDLLFVLAAWWLLLARVVITSSSFLANYSLAIAIGAWLIATIYLTQARKTKAIALKRRGTAMTGAFVGKVGKICCIILFLLSWLVSINAGLVQSSLYFWQTIGISGLAMQLFSQHLTLYWCKADLTALFLVGLQTFYVCKELIPPGFRNQATDLLLGIGKTEYFPESILSVTLFPHIILWVFITSWLYQQPKKQLAKHSEFLTLILGIVLTYLSLTNPIWRSLNLLLSTLTLGYVARIRQPTRISLVLATFLLGLITLINGIAVIFPDLNQGWWGCIFLGLMVMVWGFYLTQIKHKRQRSRVLTQTKQGCWYSGLCFSAISYSCFSAANSPYGGLLWLITPLMLSLIAKYTPHLRQRRLATAIGCIALIFTQLLVFNQLGARLLALVIATGLMFVNTFNLRRTSITMIHLGVAIALIVSLFAPLIGDSWRDYQPWLSLGGTIILLLYWLRLALLETSDAPKFGYISQRSAFGILGVGKETRNFKLISKYLQGADYWAIALITLELLVLSGVYFWLPRLELDRHYGHYLVATSLLIVGIFWRYRQQPNNLVLYTITWLGGMLAGEFIRLFTSSSLVLATSNIILGLIALVVVVLLAESNTPWARLNLSYIPLVYAILGICWRLSSFNAYTGLITLGAAMIFLNTQQRQAKINRLVKYLGFAGISGGIYELVIYQMLSIPGTVITKGLTILSLATMAIALSYRLIFWWYQKREFTTLFNLSLSQGLLIPHLHWGISSILQIFAGIIILAKNHLPSNVLIVVSIAISLCLGTYAVFQGRNINPVARIQQNDWWVYIGLGEIAATLVYGRLIISKLGLVDLWYLNGYIAFTCAIACLMYQIPWQNFGWRVTPWQQVALILPAVMVLVTAADIANFSLVLTALFYLCIAYLQRNIRWSYPSLGLMNWLAIKLIGQHHTPSMLVAGIISLSMLYIAQFDPNLQRHRHLRHYLRLLGSSIFCVTALLEQPGIVPGVIAFCFIFIGLGLRIRAFLFTGTITLIVTVLHQLIILLFTYSFLKWVVGLLTGISSIAIAARFENKRDRLVDQLKNYRDQLQGWQ